jgi:hypothetical protein
VKTKTTMKAKRTRKGRHEWITWEVRGEDGDRR